LIEEKKKVKDFLPIFKVVFLPKNHYNIIMEKNYFDRMMVSAIESMKQNKHDWPSHWDNTQKINFLDECIDWLENNDMYEQCEIVLNEKKKIKK